MAYDSLNFHIKARATSMGSRFEWPDESGKLTITGTIEADYESTFSRADNRNVSSIRSNVRQLRLAFGQPEGYLHKKGRGAGKLHFEELADRVRSGR